MAGTRSKIKSTRVKNKVSPGSGKKVRATIASKRLNNKEWADIWPRERDIIVRPERLRYVRNAIIMNGCVFCQARDNGVKPDSLCVYKNDSAMAVLNKYPYNTGHIMILPTRHCGDLVELQDDEYAAVQELVRVTAKIVKAEYRVEGMNIGLNMGRIAGAGLPDHLHWHIVPRWMGDTNFFPLLAETKVLPETLEQTFARYAKHFAGVK